MLDDLDVTKVDALEKMVKSQPWDFIINCSAYTAVDAAEDNQEICYAINKEAVSNLGRFSAEVGAKVIHVSTDYVFDGTSNVPYAESVEINPGSVYGKSKAEGEILLLENNPQSLIVRTSWLYSELPNNFYQTMVSLGQAREKLNVVFDQIGTPTYGGDLADALLYIVDEVIKGKQKFVPGIYHYSNEGVTSWYDFAIAIFEMTGINCLVSPVKSDMFPTKATRPAFSVLDKTKIKQTYQLRIPHWRASLRKMIDANFLE
jgi:dTDP-4-dehydrorhamnose reductase